MSAAAAPAEPAAPLAQLREWWSAAELAAATLPGLPASRRGVALHAEAMGWAAPEAEGRGWRQRAGRGGGLEFHISLLPLAAQAKLRLLANPPDARGAALERLADTAAWSAFEALPAARQARARDRLAVLDAVAALVSTGTSKVAAVQLVAAERGVARSQLYEWLKLVEGAAREHWLPRLAPRHQGSAGRRAACDDDAMAWLRSAWLSPSRPTVEQCLRDLARKAAAEGWPLPSNATLRRRIDAIPRNVATYHREGEDVAARLYPAQRRDRSMLHAMQWLNADGHKFDVFVRWEDGSVGRPMGVVFQDLYSGKLLSCRLAKSENGDTFRLAFGDVVERFGIPGAVTIDNTLAAANKTMSGGIAHRFRFKKRAEEMLGVFPLLGVEVHWAKPYSGQSKPIERAFGDFARDVSRHPAFEGAYTGNRPENKPWNHGERAVPIAEFQAVLAQRLAEHNARPGRQAANCRGRSFDETFDASYATAPIARATEAQRRLFLLAAEAVRVRGDATVHLFRNRYHDAALIDLVGSDVGVRFDPDHLHQPVAIYRPDGSFVCAAECILNTGFGDSEAARANARAKQMRRKGLRLQAAAERTLDAAQLARDLAALPAPESAGPAPAVIRPVFGRGNTAAALKPMTHNREEEDARLVAAVERANAARGRHLSLVPEEDE